MTNLGLANGPVKTWFWVTVVWIEDVEAIWTPGTVPSWKVGEAADPAAAGSGASPNNPATTPKGCPRHVDRFRSATF